MPFNAQIFAGVLAVCLWWVFSMSTGYGLGMLMEGAAGKPRSRGRELPDHPRLANAARTYFLARYGDGTMPLWARSFRAFFVLTMAGWFRWPGNTARTKNEKITDYTQAAQCNQA
jgi:hypothetical protein